MEIKSFYFIAISCILAFCSLSCSDDKGNENGNEPEGTLSINMRNQSNGKTLLGNTYVYIDDANNFYGPDYSIVSIGKREGLANMPTPSLTNVGRKVAVEVGHAYQIFNDLAIHKFPSGTLALKITADYHDVYVASQIKQDDEVIGATVKYLVKDVPHYDLPEYNGKVGELRGSGSEITLEFSSADFEYEPTIDSYNEFEFIKEGKKLTIRLVYFEREDIFGTYIRINNSYTYIYGDIRVY